MHTRCYQPATNDYANYGGRGIKVCDHWRRYENFLADMGRKPSKIHTLDRKDPNGNYDPENCRWATPIEQARNTTKTTWLTVDGVTKSVGEWTEITGISRQTLHRRIERGWPPGEVVSKPLRVTRRAA